MKQVYTQQKETQTPPVRSHVKVWVLCIGFLVWLLAVKATFGQSTSLANSHPSKLLAVAETRSIDVNSPTITDVPADLVVVAGANCRAVVSWVPPKATDDSELVSLAADVAPGTAFPLGTQKITYTAVDKAGNVARASFLVTVEDNTPPAVAVQNATLSLDGNGNATLSLADVRVSSSDNCGILAEVLSRTSFNRSHVGANPVTLTVTDNNGNVTEKTVTVTVQNRMGPAVVTRPVTVQPDTSGLVSLPEVLVGGTRY